MGSVLLGLAIGDALGAPFESLDAAPSPRLAAWDGGYLADGDPRIWPAGRPAGATTDDTALACALARSLARRGAFDPGDAADAYVALYRSDPVGGIGPTLRRAIKAIAAGTPWDAAGVVLPAGYCGAGTAMRAAPLGVCYRHDLAALVAAARTDATITHRSAEAEAGSAAVALGVALLLGGAPAGELRREVARRLAESDLRYTRVWLGLATAWPGDAGSDVADIVCAAFDAATAGGGAAPEDALRDALVATVRRGGDADTRASVAGALLAARFGRDALPRAWREGLGDRATIEALDAALTPAA